MMLFILEKKIKKEFCLEQEQEQEWVNVEFKEP